MFRTRKGKTFFKDNVKKLMRLKKNAKLKSLIENEETYPTLSDSTGTTLLHVAARYDNIEMIEYAIDLGCGIDAKDASGTTPLIIATKYNNNLAMRLLLHFNADIFTTNSTDEYPLKLMFDRNKTNFNSIIHFFWKKVKSNSQSAEEAADAFLKAGCSLEHAALMKDFEMTRIFLDKIKEIDTVTSHKSVFYSMLHVDSANLEVLLSHGCQVAQRITEFLWLLHHLTNKKSFRPEKLRCLGSTKNFEAVRLYATKIVDWNLLNMENIKYIRRTFEHAEKDILQVFLESAIVSHVQSRLGYNLLPHVYGNCNPGVIELLRDKGLDSDARTSTGERGMTALHFAVSFYIPRNVKILLDAGVDPNIVVEQGRSPLLYTLYPRGPLPRKIECLDLLLRHNADVEDCSKRGDCFIDYVVLSDNDHSVLADRVLAHLAMRDATGSPIKQSTMDSINAHAELKNRYETCQRQLDEMKERKVAGFLSFIKVLTSKPDEIARFVGAQDEKIIRALTHEGSLSEFNKYYSKRFKDNLGQAFRLDKLRTKMAYLIVENITSFRGHDFVVDKIINYLNFEELLVFE